MTRALSYLVILIDLALARLAWANIQRRGRRAQRRLPGDDWGRDERQRFLHPERSPVLGLLVLLAIQGLLWLAIGFALGRMSGM